MTAVAKVYPAALNVALANAIADYALLRSSDLQRVDPLHPEFEPMLSFDFVDHAIVQSDFYA